MSHLLAADPLHPDQPAHQLAQPLPLHIASTTFSVETSPGQLADEVTQRELSLPTMTFDLRCDLSWSEGGQAALREPLPPQLQPQLHILLAPPVLLLHLRAIVQPVQAVQGLRVVVLSRLTTLGVDVLQQCALSSHAPVFRLRCWEASFGPLSLLGIIWRGCFAGQCWGIHTALAGGGLLTL